MRDVNGGGGEGRLVNGTMGCARVGAVGVFGEDSAVRAMRGERDFVEAKAWFRGKGLRGAEDGGGDERKTGDEQAPPCSAEKEEIAVRFSRWGETDAGEDPSTEAGLSALFETEPCVVVEERDAGAGR